MISSRLLLKQQKTFYSISIHFNGVCVALCCCCCKKSETSFISQTTKPCKSISFYRRYSGFNGRKKGRERLIEAFLIICAYYWKSEPRYFDIACSGIKKSTCYVNKTVVSFLSTKKLWLRRWQIGFYSLASSLARAREFEELKTKK